MAKFCTKCGSPLEEGQTCKCESVKKEVKTNKSSSFTDLLKNYVELVKKSFKNPIDVLKENATEDSFNLSLISIGVSSIAMGLLICLMVKSMLSGFGSMVEIPYVKVFLLGFVTMASMIAILALVSYLLIEKVFKSNTSIKKMFVLFGLSSIIITVALLIASILSLIELDMMILYAVVAVGSMLWFAYNIKGIEFYSKLNLNYIGYAIVASYGVTSVAIYYLITEVFAKILM